YRERLRREWGIVDVEDCVAAVQALVRDGLADGERLGIRGGSAGGWTTLAALTTTDAFAAGVSYYGVAELIAFTADTHDFESRYIDGLVGTLPEDRTCTSSGRRSRTSTSCPARCCCCRVSRTRWCRRRRRSCSRPRWRRRASRTRTCRSPASSTASASRRRSSPRWRPSCPSTGRSSGSNRRGCRCCR